MEKIPVIKSKLIMPLIPDNIIISDRILKLCNKMHSSRASFIQAPAAAERLLCCFLHIKAMIRNLKRLYGTEWKMKIKTRTVFFHI